jgi:hypothetical protein
MRGSKFASGKHSWAMCDVCSVRTRYRDLRSTTVRGKLTGLRVCATCWDKDHEQNFLPYYVTADAQALYNPRPDTGLQASRKLYPPGNWPPYPAQQTARQRFRSDEEDT